MRERERERLRSAYRVDLNDDMASTMYDGDKTQMVSEKWSHKSVCHIYQCQPRTFGRTRS